MRKPGSSRVVSVFMCGLLSIPQTVPLRASQRAQAAGDVYRPCAEGPAVLARMEAGMAVQREALRRTEEQLKAAETGNLEALRQREEADVARSKAEEFVMGQARLLGYLAGADLTGATSAQRARFRQIVKRLNDAHEKVQKGGQAGLAGYAWGGALRESGFAWKELATFLDESGLAETVLSAAAKRALPPPAQLVVESFTLARDAVLAEMAQNISDQELGQLHDAYSQVRWAVSYNQEKIDNLRYLLSGCPQAQKPQVQDSPRPIPPQEPASGGTPPPAPAPPPSGRKGGPNKLGLSVAVGLVAAGAGALAIAKAMEGAAGTDAATGSSGGPPTLVSFTTFVCSGNSCSGTVTINFPSVMNSGSITVVSTSGFMGQASVSSTSPPGRVTFNLVKTPYLTCYQTQREIGIWNGRTIDGPQTYSITGVSIPVSCQ